MSVDLDAVLRDINAIRGEYGLPSIAELPKGTLADADCCPIARGLSSGDGSYCALVSHDGWHWASDSTVAVYDGPHRTTEAMEAFVTAFDAGELPEFIEP